LNVDFEKCFILNKGGIIIIIIQLPTNRTANAPFLLFILFLLKAKL